jgi:hypothetical protein
MKGEIVDRFQIVGFVLSVAISVGLIVSKQDTVTSVVLGLLVASITQLFDLQLRNVAFEERILRASALSRKLFHDEWLLRSIEEIVTGYVNASDKWFELFRLRAQDFIHECRDGLRSLSNDDMTVGFDSPFRIGPDAYEKYAKESIQVTNCGSPSYWRSVFSQKYWQANGNAIRRGVKITRIFILTHEALDSLTDILERQRSIGVDVYVVTADEVPQDSVEMLMIMDNRLGVVYDLGADGWIKEERITIHQERVEKLQRRFNFLMRYARKLEDVYGNSNDLKQRADRH